MLRTRDGINFNQEFVLTIFKPRSTKAVEAVKIAVLCTVLYASAARTQEFRPEHRDLDEIKRSGEIVMGLPDNAPALFMYEGKPMGYEYELSKSFADSLGVKLKIVTFAQWSSMEKALKNGEVDIAAPSVPVYPEKYDTLSFSRPYMSTRNTVVSHRDNVQGSLLSDAVPIAGPKYTSEWHSRGLPLYAEKSFGDTSSLIRKVASKQIAQTITNEHIAKNARRNFPETIIGSSTGPSVGISWAVNPKSCILLQTIDSFFAECEKNGNFEELHEKYLSDIAGLDAIDSIAFLDKTKTFLPAYKNIIKSEAKDKGFDWRLITALIYQESSFNHRAEGGAGAAGLMQLLPSTAADLGATNLMNPSSNIKAGVGYLKDLFDILPGETETDRLSFALAAYNMGPNSLLAAKNATLSKGLNNLKWKDVAEVMKNPRKGRAGRKVSGFHFRGSRTVDYVNKIMAYFEILKYREIKPPPVCIYGLPPAAKV